VRYSVKLVTSNGRDFAHVTFFGSRIPGREENYSVQRIVEGIGLQDDDLSD
jgi:hypothetical protein